MTLLAAVQGSALLASALRDPELLSAQVRYLHRWIDTVAASTAGAEPTTGG